MKLVFATNNAHKLEEIKEMLGSQHEIVSLKEIQCHECPSKSPVYSREIWLGLFRR